MALATDFLEDVGPKKLGSHYGEDARFLPHVMKGMWLHLEDDAWGILVQGKEWVACFLLCLSAHMDSLLGDNPSTTVLISQISSASSVRYVDEPKRGKSTVKTIEKVAKSTEKCGVDCWHNCSR
ncbi:hypothetical protein PIB30_075739 [Stylosanthes scabra]|uniref:Uncharacterized protein n=1 Tax=Stylosanthes scabra TaxID=79078 RepID=A0ABU6TPP2_9FABA|nr:hypothetical protein [Stylosanthes scabra]